MNHCQTVIEISKRLPRLKRRDVAEVLEITAELQLEELRNVRSHVGNFVSKNDLLRYAVNLYLASQEDLPGSRRAIANPRKHTQNREKRSDIPDTAGITRTALQQNDPYFILSNLLIG